MYKMIQDIYPNKFNNQYSRQTPGDKSYVFVIQKDAVFLRESNTTMPFPRYDEVAKYNWRMRYLFSINRESYFLVDAETVDGKILEQMRKESHYQFHPRSSLRNKLAKLPCFAAAVACQLAGWYRNNRYCGQCGKLLVPSASERMLECKHCGNMVYPKISPAVIVGIVHNDQILMTKYADKRNGTRYALIAGFTEIGETIEETVEREVMEEVGVKVKNIRYYKSQPWPFSDTLLMGFFCELDGSDRITMDTNELAEALWMSRDDMEIEDDGISLTYEMMARFKEGTY